MLIAGALATAAALAGLVVGFAGSSAGDLGAGPALGVLLYVMAFLPNVLVAGIALALGAPLEMGAQAAFPAGIAGSVQEYSLVEPGQGAAPGYTLALLAIPLIACLAGGFIARRTRGTSGQQVVVVGVAAVVFSGILAGLAAIGDVRLETTSAQDATFALAAADPAGVLFLGLGWALLMGAVGWRIADVLDEGSQARGEASGPRPESRRP